MPTMPTLQQQFQFLESRAAHIESRVRMIEHGTIQYPQLVGISREANPHADSILYYSYDGTGEMVDLANRANDFPNVAVVENQHSVNIQWKGLAYDWSDREIGRAMLVGTNLSDRKVRLAFRIAEEEKERTFLEGDAGYRWDGMINNTNVPRTLHTTSWETDSDENVFNAVNRLIGGAWSGTNQVHICDTLLLPVDTFVALGRPMGNDASRSVMDYIKKYNPYTALTGNELMIRTLRQLNTAGDSRAGVDTNNGYPANFDWASRMATTRAIAYPRNMDVLRYHIPQELQFIEPQRMGMLWKYHGTMVLGGLEIMLPNAMRYLDGV